jgi:hypothetical protein
VIEEKKQNAASSTVGPSDTLLSSDYANMSSKDIKRLVSEMTNSDNDYFTQDSGGTSTLYLYPLINNCPTYVNSK